MKRRPASGIASRVPSASANSCANKLKKASPDFAGETQVTLTASPNVPYQVIICTMDAVRTAANGDELFPDVYFGVAR